MPVTARDLSASGILIKNMPSRLKLVASALVITLLAMPLSALASCCWHMPQTERCTPHCPTMSRHVSPVTIQEALANGPCCRVTAARPTPALMPQVPGVSGYVAPIFIASALDAPGILTKAEPPDPLDRASSPSLQSVFCTFLI